MSKEKLDMSPGLSWLSTILGFIEKYGIWTIIKGCFLLIIVSFVIRVCTDPSFIYDSYLEYAEQSHRMELEQRHYYDKQVENIISKYLYKYRADRIWIINYHNGTMDWRHGTMRFEKCNEGVPYIRDQYDNFNLTWITLTNYVQDHEYFVGSIEDLKEIDNVLYLKLKSNNINYIACILIRDTVNYPIGIFGVSYQEIPDKITQGKLHDYLIVDKMEIQPLIESKRRK